MEVQVSFYKALCGLNKSLYEGSERNKTISGKSIDDPNKANSSQNYEEMDLRLDTLLEAATEWLYHYYKNKENIGAKKNTDLYDR